MILIKELFVRKGKNFGLKCENCTIKDNSVNLIVGPNGAGKTTLIKGILGLDACAKRIVYENSILLNRANTMLFRQRTGYAPQEIRFNSLHIFNVGYAMELAFWKRKSSIKNIRKEIDYALDICGLLRYRDFPVSFLSGGEKRRFLIARALATSVDYIFLDEPDAFLDFDFTKNLPEILSDYKKKKKLTVVISTHNNELFNNISDVLISVKNGYVKC